MIFTAGDRVLELVEIHTQEARIIERRDPGLAKVISGIAAEYAAAVEGALPEWIPLSDVRQAKGHSRRWWWAKCKELERRSPPLARKSGRAWEVRRAALEEIPRKAGHGDEIVFGDDIRAAAERLAGDE